MYRVSILRLTATLLGVTAVPAVAADAVVPAAPDALIYCVRCHGADGVSPNDQWPNLAGQNAPYLRAQLNAFRDRRRTDPFMQNWASMLTQEQLDAIVRYYSQLPTPGAKAQISSGNPQ